MYLSCPKPEPSQGLSIDSYEGASYNESRQSWWISEIGGYIRFRFTLASLHGVTVNFRLCSSGSAGHSDCPVTIMANQNPIVTDFDPGIFDFYNRSWYIPPTMLTEGQNTLTIQLVNGHTAVFVQTVWLMDYQMQHQLQNAWCWSAVSTSTSVFYDEHSPWTQCSLVSKVLNQPGCCQDGSTPQCNQPYYLDKGLGATGNLESVSTGAQTPTTVQTQMDAIRPLAIRVGWQGGGGHFILISGIGEEQTMVAVQDPWFGPSYIKYNVLVEKYQGMGHWTHSYFTKPAPKE